MAGSWICEGRRVWSAGILGRLPHQEDTRSLREGFGGGAINAMEKSVSPEGDDGVTMIAGRAAFSSTSGSDRSSQSSDTSCKLLVRFRCLFRRTEGCGDQGIIETLWQAVEATRTCTDALFNTRVWEMRA